MDGKKLIETTCQFCGNDLAHGFDSLEEYIDLILEKRYYPIRCSKCKKVFNMKDLLI